LARRPRWRKLDHWCSTEHNEREPSTGYVARVSDNTLGAGFTNNSVRKESSTTVTRTFTPKAGQVQRDWVVIDATDVVLGRLASHAAALLRGKHKPTFANHVDSGDFVVIINADKVALTGQKLNQKMAYRHSGFPGGIKAVSYSELLEKNPVRAVEKAVRGMLPKNTLGRQQLSKLKVYVGAEHPHAAQRPQPYTLDQVAQRGASE
jgi:large subunit ribosomal protein L13